MGNEESKQLCASLLHADTEGDVIQFLKQAGFWNDTKAWRYYGDREDNFSIIGNQQSRPEAALVEKVVNSVDAVLMGECWLRGVVPDSPEAPKSIHEAVALYFADNSARSDSLGHLENWADRKRTEISRRIAVTATGGRATSNGSANPCFTIADVGEGQTSTSMPLTLLSLNQKNKLKIPFVQGKFNMGGTGVLQFCGRHNLQLVISRRNPHILQSNKTGSDEMWSLAIVRREDPPPGHRSSVYTYLAPIEANRRPRRGDVLCFSADKFPIFPEGRDPYGRDAEWGTAIKLYEYDATGFRTMMFRKDGLLSRLDILLPGVALPIRLHECRDYRGHAGSFETTLSGLAARLEDNKAVNLEDGFPTTCQFMARGELMYAKLYAFKKGKAETYRKSEGIIFTVNGQTHGHLPLSFFGRKNVGMGRLDDSILVMVDCTELSGRAREDLFMNSRDRLRSGDLRDAIERQLESMIRDHQGLRALRERRKREEVESKLAGHRPLEHALESILRSSPALLSLFHLGTRLPNPFRVKEVTSANRPYRGKYRPTYFKFQKLPYGQRLERTAAVNMRSRIIFETDVVNDYFSRLQNKGLFALRTVDGGKVERVQDYSLNLHNGKATLNVTLPDDSSVGDIIDYVATVTDDTMVGEFVNRFTLTVGPAQQVRGGGDQESKPPVDKEGHLRELPSGLALPDIREVYEADWHKRKHKFDEYSALEIIQEEASVRESLDGGDSAVYSFWVNMDNIYFRTECKSSWEDTEILRARWIYGLALVGMALIRAEPGTRKLEETIKREDRVIDEAGLTLEEQVFQTCEALAPVLLPLIEKLGTLSEQQVPIGSQIGDDD
jgi:hypothetical protein